MKYFFIILTLSICNSSAAQNSWEWSRSIGARIDGSSSDRSVEDMSSATATDHEGNVYVAGLFSDSIVQDGFRLFTAPRTPSSTPIDIFVGKFDRQGQLLWLKSFNANFVTSATVDAENNFYIVGSYGPFITVGDTT